MTTWIKVAILALCCALSAWGGYTWRDRGAERDAAVRDAADATTVATVATEARTMDHADQAAAAPIEQDRIDQAANNEKQFQIIYRDVVRYVQSAPDATGCDLDADGLRIWRAANAGKISSDSEHHDSSDAAGAVPR